MTVPKTYEDKNGFAYMDRQQTEGNGFDAFCPAPETSVTENNLMEETVLRFWETWTKQLIYMKIHRLTLPFWMPCVS